MWATPPDTLLAALVMSPAWFFKVSSEPFPLLMTSPSPLCLASSTICGSSWLKPRNAPLAAWTITSATMAITTTIATTSTVAHARRLQPSRRSIVVATGERTATHKTETNRRSRTLLIDASAAPAAMTTAAIRIVRTEIETASSRRGASAVFRPPTPPLASRRPPSVDVDRRNLCVGSVHRQSVPRFAATPVPPAPKLLPWPAQPKALAAWFACRAAARFRDLQLPARACRGLHASRESGLTDRL